MARRLISFAWAGSSALALVISWSACEPDFASLLEGNTSGMGGSGAMSSTTTSGASTGPIGSGGATTASATGTGGSATTSGSTASTTGATASSSSSGLPDAGPLLSFTFDTAADITSWSGRTYVNGLTNPTVTFSSKLGHDAPGAIESSMTFTNISQAAYIRYVVPSSPTPPTKPDFSGKTLTAWVYVESTTATVELTAFAEDIPNTNFLNGGGTNVDPTTTPQWVQLTFAIPQKSASFDPTNLNQLGIQLYSLSGGTTGDAGTADAGATGTIVLAVDDIVVK